MSYLGLVVLAVVVGCVAVVPYLMFRVPLARLQGLLDDGKLSGFSGVLEGQYQKHYVKFLMRTGSPRSPGRVALFSIHLMMFGTQENKTTMDHVKVDCLHRDAVGQSMRPKGGPLYAVMGPEWVTRWADQPNVRAVLDDLFKNFRARQMTVEFRICELDLRGLFGHPPEEVKKILDGLLILEETLAQAALQKS